MCRTSPRSTSFSICRHVFMKFSWIYGRASGLRDSTEQPGGWKFGNGQWTKYASRYSSCRSASDFRHERDHVRFAVLVVPQLRRDPQRLARNTAERVLKHRRRSGLRCRKPRRSRNGGSPLPGAGDGRRHLLGRHMVGAESAQADSRHVGAGVQRPSRDACRVDGIQDSDFLL